MVNEYVRVEDASDPNIYIILTVKPIGQCLSHTLAFVVTSPRTNWIDMAPTIIIFNVSNTNKTASNSTY